MSTKVRALLTTAQRIGIDVAFPFGDFSTFLSSLSPDRIGIEFYCCDDQESIIELALEFDGSAASNSARVFKDALIRSEVKLGFDCLFLREGESISSEAGLVCVEIDPEVMCLPSGKEIAIAQPLLNAASDVLRQAHTTNSKICYSVDLKRTEGNPDYARALIPALAELRTGRYSVSSLEQSVSQAFDIARMGGWYARERICIPKSAAAKDEVWIESLVRHHLKGIESTLSDELVPLRWMPYTNVSQENTLQAFIGRLRHIDYLGHVFERIVPSDSVQHVLLRSLDQARRVRHNPVNGEYAFVSYAHMNVDFVQGLLRRLEDVGIKYWCDKGLEPGSRWDEQLEDRIRNCGVFIACVSDDYQQSKYCRREIKFADLVDKLILPVASSAWVWGQGFQMMFQELQVTSFDGGRGFTDLHRMLQVQAPQIFN